MEELPVVECNVAVDPQDAHRRQACTVLPSDCQCQCAGMCRLVEHFGSQKSRRAIKAREAAEKKAKEEAEFERAERASRAEQAATDFELFQVRPHSS